MLKLKIALDRIVYNATRLSKACFFRFEVQHNLNTTGDIAGFV